MRLLLLSTLLAACQAEAIPFVQEFDGEVARTYVARQLEFGPRIPGTAGHAAMAEWLEAEARTRADTVLVQRWTHRSAAGVDLPLVNVIARFRPEATERLLFLAHWDTRPVSDAYGSSDPTAPLPGANDGGSGVAILLGIADVLQRTPPEIGVDLLFVDGEDYGEFATDTDVLLGAKYYAANMLPGPKPRFAVLFDMVGHANPQFRKEGNSVIAASAAVDLVWGVAADLGYQDVFLPEVGDPITDDHVPLQRVGVAAIDIIEIYPHWHTPEDTLDKISAGTLQKVGNVATAVIRREAARRDR
jgi:Zn-dependent M28 family amino/carboxypeptidase